MKTKERWKWVRGFIGYYRVSTKGRVRSVNRKIIRTKGGPAFIQGRLLKYHTDRDGYRFVRLSKNNNKRSYSVHYLVLITFVGLCPKDKQCRHLNGNPGDNRLTNVKWGTVSRNARDRERHGTDLKGERNPSAKLSENEIRTIRRIYKTGKYSQNRIAEMFGVYQTGISHIVTRKVWGHVV